MAQGRVATVKTGKSAGRVLKSVQATRAKRIRAGAKIALNRIAQSKTAGGVKGRLASRLKSRVRASGVSTGG